MTETSRPYESCPFCNPSGDRIFFRSDHVIGLWDQYPVSPGHALLVPTRHVATWFEAAATERLALVTALDEAKSQIERFHRPDGYNIGINAGAAAGQTIHHLHVHLIPRFAGDVRDPRGGVRYVIPDKANYLTEVRDVHSPRQTSPALLVAGGDTDPLLPHLKAELARASAVDIAVAFTLRSGVEATWNYLQDLLDRGGRLRFLTGDYMEATDPDALLRLLDLEAPTPTALYRRVFQTGTKATVDRLTPRSFHPKAYIFTYPDGTGSAFVGSSNLSLSALQSGVEWNYRIVSAQETKGFREVRAAFDTLFSGPATTELTPDWISAYRARRKAISVSQFVDLPREIEPEPAAPVPIPHEVQSAALEALRSTREHGHKAGLVVLATGLGKTWLSAFDSLPYERVLFVAHREEILGQATRTYRRIRPSAYLGHYNGTEKHPDASVLFASVQTLSKRKNLYSFSAEHFDYIVIDEFHHASAATYRRLISHFKPRFLLGLTATPERSDGADLLDLCGGNLVYRCDLAEGIRRELLCPFHYFGVPDEVDYRNIPWRSTRFDEEALTAAVATQSRAQNAMDQLNSRGGRKTIAFCVSQRHADFMARFLGENGKRAVAVHAGPTSAARTDSLERLAKGDLDVVCAVDMFNEGVDLPELDTILMLRPTESPILWLQQFGRGLRKAHADKRLTVIDYIGNHRTFLLKPRTLFNVVGGDAAVQHLLGQIQSQTVELPPGCEVTYDLRAIDILRGLLRVKPDAAESLRTYVQDFKERHGVRPTALEAYRDGFNPRAMQAGYGSWLGFLKGEQFLDESETRVVERMPEFFKSLETTPMTKSFKMLVLLGMLNADRLPGSITLEALSGEVRALLERYARVRSEFGDSLASDETLVAHLERNPVAAWAGGAGTGGQRYFEFIDGLFSSRLSVSPNDREALQTCIREIAEWRLAEYLDREPEGDSEATLKVSHAEGRPILFLPDRASFIASPEGWTPVRVGGETYSANFAKIAINVIREQGSDVNVLPRILRGWFGPTAGAPGTRHQVRLRRDADVWSLEPIGVVSSGPTLWKEYSREQIPKLFDLEFNAPVWQQGFVRRGSTTFLLVTLDKRDKQVEHRYEDRFLSPTRFQWQSQNRTKRDNKDGLSIKEHVARGIHVHLFVRRRAKLPSQKASPFTYCGEVRFVSWSGDSPITVHWDLAQPLPATLHQEFQLDR